MQMEKRFILAMVLSMLFVMFYRYAFLPEPSTPQPGPVDVVPVGSGGETGKESPSTTLPPAASWEAVAEQPPQEPVTEAAERDIVVVDPLYRVTLTNRGGLLKSWEFLEREEASVELVPQGFPAETSGFLALRTDAPDLAGQLNSVNYEVAVAGFETLHSREISTPAEITFNYQGANFRVVKTLRFGASDHVVEVAAKVERGGMAMPTQLQLGPGIRDLESMSENSRYPAKMVILNGNSVERIAFDDVEAIRSFSGNIQWAGIESQYFASIMLPSSGGSIQSAQLYPYSWNKDGSKVPLAWWQAPIAPQESYRVFLGPKQQGVLQSVQPSLKEVIDFGWFGIIVEPLLVSLNWIYAGVRNYGVAIIILTFLITLALFPLRYKQMVSMKKLQKLQPQVKAIQERYKKAKKSAQERQKMNVEMMALYKKHNVNPLGGCLPLLLQMPILFAFYSMLSVSYELRGAPFMLWIRDLAAKDPYYVTPIVMGLTMLVSMKMTPSPSTDPMQSKMMMFMPIMMMFMFLNLSAGLNLYFLFSNLFSIGMQKASERLLPALRN